jgi:signal transduction histidine kinase
VTIDLREISDGLASIDVPDPSPRNNPRVGLRETARIQALFGHATDGFKRQRLQIEYAAQQRREAEVRKGRFLAHISHELKSPLNSILGFSEVLLGELDGPMSPEQQVLTAQIWRHGDGLLRFILALLDLSRLDETSRDHTDNTGSSSLRSRRCTPAGLAQSLREQCRADPTEQIRLVVTDKTLPNTPEMMIDSTLTARVALLLAGALGDGIKDGEISVELSTRNDEVIISIAATELGEETHERRAFLRGWSDLLNPGGAKDVVEAISIPLRLAQTIVRIQGGRISMETDQPWPTLTLSCPTAGS